MTVTPEDEELVTGGIAEADGVEACCSSSETNVFPNSINNLRNGAQYTKTCKTAFAKHIFPEFINPLVRILSIPPPPGPLVSKFSNSLFFAGITGTIGNIEGFVAEAGMEKPITDEVGSPVR